MVPQWQRLFAAFPASLCVLLFFLMLTVRDSIRYSIPPFGGGGVWAGGERGVDWRRWRQPEEAGVGVAVAAAAAAASFPSECRGTKLILLEGQLTAEYHKAVCIS